MPSRMRPTGTDQREADFVYATNERDTPLVPNLRGGRLGLEARLAVAPLPQQARANDDAFLKVEDRQADNVDLTDRLRKDIDVIAPSVTDLLKVAQDRMQEARASLNTSQRDPAVTKETLALASLEEARTRVLASVAAALAALS